MPHTTRHTPFTGAFHTEGTFTGHYGIHKVAKFGKKIGLHKSMGQVVDNLTLQRLKIETPDIVKRMGV